VYPIAFGVTERVHCVYILYNVRSLMRPICTLLGFRRHHSMCYTRLFTNLLVVITIFLVYFLIIFFIIVSGVRLSPLGTAATTGLLYHPQMIDEGDCGEIGGMKICRGTRITRRKPAPAPLCPPQIPHDQTRKPATNRLSYGTASLALGPRPVRRPAVVLFRLST
jgi:hypothetical protein